MTSRSRHVVDPRTLISVTGPKATVWFRMGAESNHGAFKALIPDSMY